MQKYLIMLFYVFLRFKISMNLMITWSLCARECFSHHVAGRGWPEDQTEKLLIKSIHMGQIGLEHHLHRQICHQRAIHECLCSPHAWIRSHRMADCMTSGASTESRDITCENVLTVEGMIPHRVNHRVRPEPFLDGVAFSVDYHRVCVSEIKK